MTDGNLGPITTSLALAEECTADLDSVYKHRWETDGWYWLQHGPQETTCFPSGYSALTSQYFSPANCPYGYTPACSSTYAIGTITETIQTCCPTEYDYQCQTKTSYPWHYTLGCTNDVSESEWTTWTVIDVSDKSSTITTSTGLEGGLNAFSIQVRFQSSDFVSTTSSINTPTSASSSTKETASTSNDNNVNDVDQSSSSLGTSAIVGIVVGVLAAVGLTVALIFLFVRRQRQKRNAIEAQAAYIAQEMDGAGVGAWHSSAAVSKYQQPSLPTELPSGSPHFELDAGPQENQGGRR